jgi:methionyl-tRNA synthetase
MSDELEKVPAAPKAPEVVKAPEAVKAPEPVQPKEVLVNINDFKKFQFVIARIQEVVLHPNADKLYVIKVDTGSEVRQVVAGIRRSYTPEQLVGKRVALVANLEPAVIRGVESRGMILAASDEQGISVLSPDRDVVLGSTVK